MSKEQKLTKIFQRQKKRVCSLEISSKKEVSYNIIETIPSSFCSVIWIGTYDKPPEEIEPLMIAAELIKRGHPTVLHFSARNNTQKSALKNLEYAKKVGVRNILVVRGASPECQLQKEDYDFPYSIDLIKFIKKKFGDYFDLCVPGYPYKHPESKDVEEDMKYLKTKSDAGAKFIISQAAFSYDIYKEYLRNCQKYKVKMQIIPGVYIIRTVVDFCLLKKICKVPEDDAAVQFVKKHKGKDEEIAAYGIKTTHDIIKKILADSEFCPPHIYTMNEFASIKDFLEDLDK